MSDFKFKTKPYAHQEQAFNIMKDRETFALIADMGCVDKDTEYLSPTGWVKMSEYAGGEVAQWDMETNEAVFVEPTEYHVKPCPDPMIRFKNTRGLDMLLSKDHRVVWKGYGTKMQESPALDVADRYWGGSVGKTRFPATFTLNSNTEMGINDAQLRLQVAVMADGHFPSNCATDRVTLRLKKGAKVTRLRGILDECGFDRSDKKSCYERQEEATGFWVFSFNAPIKTKTYKGFWDASLEQREAIADECIYWDGSSRKAGGRAFYTRDRDSADFIQYCFSSTGTRASVNRYTRRDGIDYVVHATERSFYNIGSGKDNVTYEDSPDGKMYCFTVPSTYLVFRRNGCIFCSGNTGKSKMLLDNACYLYNQGKIDAILVLAPSGVHQNWVINEIPTHLALPPHLYASSAWNSAMRKEDKESLAAVVDLKLGLRIVCMNVEALITKKGATFIEKYMRMFRTMLILDESQKFKTPQAKRTKAVLKLGKLAPYKRISTGTPITNSPLDAYSQFAFLDPYILGFQSFVAFRAHFAILEKKINHAQQRQYTQVMGFRNLDELQQLIKPHSFRVTKEECLDLPDKIYEKVYFDLSPEQKRLYKVIKEEVMLEMAEGRVTAQLAITKLLRLSQLISGYMTTEEGDIIDVKGGDVKLKLLKDILEDNQEKTIIWCRFIHEIHQVTAMLGDECVAYYGATESDDRAKNVQDFQLSPKIKYFVANKTASTGLTLTRASSVIYYSNSYSLEDRLQSEDRAMRIGQKKNVVYRDLVARGTVDESIIKALRSKQNIADTIIKDIASFIS